MTGTIDTRLEAKLGFDRIRAQIADRCSTEYAAQRVAVEGFITDPAAIRRNLVSQVAGSVRWDTCVRVMAERFGAERFVEFGPGTVLTGLVRKILPGAALHNVSNADGLADA